MHAIDLFSKYVCIVPLKDKRGIIVNAFQKISSKGCKPNKIWVDQGGEFYNNLFNRFLKINNIEMYSTYNEGKFVVAERFIRTLKNKIFKACVRYFSLFLKDKCISSLFRMKYIEKKFNLQLFFLPTVSRTFILSSGTMRYPPS